MSYDRAAGRVPSGFLPQEGESSGTFCPHRLLSSTKQFYTLQTTLLPAVDTPVAEDFSMASSSGDDPLSIHSHFSFIGSSSDVSARAHASRVWAPLAPCLRDPLYVMNILFGGVYWRSCSYSAEAI